MNNDVHQRTIAMIMADGRPRIITDIQYALKSRGLRMDPSEISQALQSLVRSGDLAKDGRGPNEDSFIDICGYAALAAELSDE